MTTEKVTTEEQYALGMCYLNGDMGIQEDWSRGVSWLKKAAAEGHAEAAYRLGECVANCQGFPMRETNPAAALAWFTKAAEQGHREAARRADSLMKFYTDEELEEALAELS